MSSSRPIIESQWGSNGDGSWWLVITLHNGNNYWTSLPACIKAESEEAAMKEMTRQVSSLAEILGARA